MNLEDVQTPPKPEALVEAERRHRDITRKRRELDEKLQALQAELNRRALGLDDEDTVARLVSGEIQSLDGERLPQEADEIRRQLEFYRKAEGELRQRLAKQRDKHASQIAAAYRPLHQAAVAKIWEALQVLAEANQAEEMIHLAVPGIRLPHLTFPNIGKLGADGGPAQHWKNRVEQLGYLREPEPPAEPKGNRLVPRRTRSMATGSAEPAAPMAASAKD